MGDLSDLKLKTYKIEVFYWLIIKTLLTVDLFVYILAFLIYFN